MGAADDIVSQSKFFVDGPMGNFQLARCKTADVDDDKDAEVVTSIGFDDGTGFRYKPGGGSITLEVYREKGTPELDYRKARRLQWKFAFTIQDVGGGREQYFCTVGQVKRKDDDAGSHMDTVKLLYTKYRSLPAVAA